MEKFQLADDITVFCITATSFPQGIMDAMNRLHTLAPATEERRYFGISRPGNDGVIVYRAAAEEVQKGELAAHGLEKFIIRKGTYIEKIVHDLPANIPAIGEAFEELIQSNDIDPEGYCIEWYLSEVSVRCMVKLSS